MLDDVTWDREAESFADFLARAAEAQHPGIDLAVIAPRQSRREFGRALKYRAKIVKFVRQAGWSFDPRGFYVYLLWGDDPKCPLYIGRSTNLTQRLGTHMSDPEKAGVVRVQVIPRGTREEMNELESALIRAYQPPLNRFIPQN